MNKINLKGITSEAITNVLILVVALINAILQMLGINTLPIENEELSAIVSGVFLVGMALWNTWKNRNVTTVSQEVQQIADAVKNGELLIEDVRALISKIKK
jgi:SPP1 family holin